LGTRDQIASDQVNTSHPPVRRQPQHKSRERAGSETSTAALDVATTSAALVLSVVLLQACLAATGPGVRRIQRLRSGTPAGRLWPRSSRHPVQGALWRPERTAALETKMRLVDAERRRPRLRSRWPEGPGVTHVEERCV
jgi:hypothetical protein